MASTSQALEGLKPFNSQTTILIALSVVLTSISFLQVITRCVVRFVIIRTPGMDDYMIIIAMIFTIGFVVNMFVAQMAGVGMPMMTLTPDEMTIILKVTLAVQIIYYTIIVCIKSSIVFMYNRFAIDEFFKKLCIGTNVVLAIFFVVCIGVTLGQCTPLEMAWDITKLVEGHCISTTAFFYFTSGFNIVTDIWILLMPIPTLKKLQIDQRNRLILYCVFGVGGFATAMSCVRLYSIHTYTLATDPFRDGVLINIWSIVEMNVAIACANAPALKPIFSPRKLMEARKREGNSTPNPGQPRLSKVAKAESTSQMNITAIQSAESARSSSRASPVTDEFELDNPRRSYV